MKSKSQRLAVVLTLAERKEDSAMDALRQARRYLDDQERQLSGLESYHQQYIQNYRESMASRVTIHQLQSYQGFIEQLDKAISHQQAVVETARQQFERERQQWIECREKRKGLADLIERYRQQEQLASDKRDAKRIEDDLNSRRLRS